jgi:hypothetical protein
MTDHPRWYDVDCPRCERPAIRVRDEDGRWVWECRTAAHNNQETDDE